MCHQRNANVKVIGDNVIDARLGLEGGRTIVLSNNAIFYPYARVSLTGRYSYGGRIQADTLFFDPNLDGPGIEYGAGVIVQANDHIQAYLAFIAANSRHYRQPWGVNFGFRYEF